MGNGKNFNLYLMEGEVTGSIKCTLANWTGLAYKIPRLLLDSHKGRSDLKQSGVYFLFSKDENDNGEVYVGQAGIRKNGEGLLNRVIEHFRDDTYFYEAVMISTQNNSFGPTEISYLENRFTNMAKENARYKVRNGNDPHLGNVTEEKQSELEDFVMYSKMVMGVLGYKIFVPIVKFDDRKTNEIHANDESEMILYLSRKSNKSKRTIEAQCKMTSEGFVVLEGSMIEEIDSEAIPTSIKKLRDEYKMAGTISGGKLTKNCLFNSPSYAAAFVIGMNTNGKTDWKNKDGKTLRDIEIMEVESSLE